MSHALDFRKPRVHRIEERFGEDRASRRIRQEAIAVRRSELSLRAGDGRSRTFQAGALPSERTQKGTGYIKHALTLRASDVRK